MSEPLTRHPLGAKVVLEPGIKHANFFNGRVLTARDLQDEQLANRQQRQQLGRSIGAGVVAGMELRLVAEGVGTEAPVVGVSGGLALNGHGQPIELPVAEVHVALRRTVATPPSGKVFSDCEPLQSTPDIVGKGVYLFTVAPTTDYREQAPLVSLNGGGKADGCGDRYAVEGVVFRLFELPLATLKGLSAARRAELVTLLSQSEQQSLSAPGRIAARSLLRNLLAHACFASEQRAERSADPFGAVGSPAGLLGSLAEEQLLSACEVPLGLILWTNAGVRFVDMWAVRRWATLPAALLSRAAHGAGEALRLAMIAQFEQHAADLVERHQAAGLLGALRARDLFRYLPPCGALPIAIAGAPGPPIGFVPTMFLDGVPSRPIVTIEGALIEGLYHDALACPPLSLESGEFCWCYRTRENAIATEGGTARPALYLAHGHLGYRGDARINLARWGYSHIAGIPVF